MEKGKKIPPQEASRTNPVAKPEDTKGGINNKVSSGLIGKKLAEQAEENEEMPMHHLIADKDYPSGIREWMITSPSDLKYPTLVVAAAMLSVYLTRVRIQYVYDNQGEKSAIGDKVSLSCLICFKTTCAAASSVSSTLLLIS